jgi:murein DD-endopeptidase MepM/ murein hydrolase activator NlpD
MTRLRHITYSTILVFVLNACATSYHTQEYYRIKPGDTLFQIAHNHHQSVENLMRWNNLASANHIQTGQRLRLKRPPNRHKVASHGSSKTRTTAPLATQAVKTPLPNLRLIWPASGKVVPSLRPAYAQGLSILNVQGSPVIAAATGMVAYAGRGLRGYGNLIIIQHSADFLTVYAHNQRLLVKPGQRVYQGQKIAFMGKSDNTRVELYFELRHSGKPVDPRRVLPKR